MVDNISELQPHLVVYLTNDIEPNEAHILCFTQVRMLANGDEYAGDCEKLIRVLAKFIVDSYD